MAGLEAAISETNFLPFVYGRLDQANSLAFVMAGLDPAI